MKWRPIETFKDDGQKHLFWIDWADDCKQNKPLRNDADTRMVFCRHGCWSSVHKALYWCSVKPPVKNTAADNAQLREENEWLKKDRDSWKHANAVMFDRVHAALGSPSFVKNSGRHISECVEDVVKERDNLLAYSTQLIALLKEVQRLQWENAWTGGGVWLEIEDALGNHGKRSS